MIGTSIAELVLWNSGHPREMLPFVSSLGSLCPNMRRLNLGLGCYAVKHVGGDIQKTYVGAPAMSAISQTIAVVPPATGIVDCRYCRHVPLQTVIIITPLSPSLRELTLSSSSLAELVRAFPYPSVPPIAVAELGRPSGRSVKHVYSAT